MIPDAKCQNCDWTGPADLCGPLKNAHERVQPGDVMPAGECPLCNASAMIVEDEQQPSATVITRPLPEQATHFGLEQTARSLAAVMAITHPQHTYRVQNADRHGYRVAVYRPPAYPKMVPDGYLRLRAT